MDLSLVLQNGQQAGLLWCGISGRSLGKLPPNESIDLHLSMIAIQPGLQVNEYGVLILNLTQFDLVDNFISLT